LFRADLLSEADLSFALMSCGELAIPLGHALIQTGVLKPNVVAAALGYQKLLRQKSVDIEQVVANLKELAAARNASVRPDQSEGAKS
jgi:hypothetical protein